MKNLIYLLSGAALILGFIIGTTISDVCAQSSFPMCVTIYKYLVWPNFQSGVIPVASNNPGYLTSSPMYVSNNNDVVVRTGLTANNYVSSPYLVTNKLNAVDEIYTGGLIRGGAFQFMPRDTAPTNPQEGMMYYDSSDKKFYCYKNNQWSECFKPPEVPPTQISNVITAMGMFRGHSAISSGYVYDYVALYYNGEWHYPDARDTECNLVSGGPFSNFIDFWCGYTRLYQDRAGTDRKPYIYAYCPSDYIRIGCSSYVSGNWASDLAYDVSPGAFPLENGCGTPMVQSRLVYRVDAYCLKVK